MTAQQQQNVTQPYNDPIQANIYDPGRNNPAPTPNKNPHALVNHSTTGPIAPVTGKKPLKR